MKHEIYHEFDMKYIYYDDDFMILETPYTIMTLIMYLQWYNLTDSVTVFSSQEIKWEIKSLHSKLSQIYAQLLHISFMHD